MYSIFYTQPVETLLEKKIYDRPLALLATRKSYDHFVDYTTEAYRMAILAEKEAKRLAEVKKATHEMSKTWDNTIENIKKKRSEDLIARHKQEEEDRIQFVKEMAAKKAAENLEVIKEARKLLFYRKPECRLINRALLTSECLRELEAQIQFQKTLEGLDKEQSNEYLERIKKDVEKHEEEERKKAEEQAIKNKIYAKELKKQMEEKSSDLKRLEIEEKEAEKQDLINMSKELELIKKCEIEETEKKKKQLNELFLDALEKRKKQEIKIKRDEQFQERAMAAYNKTKRKIDKKLKMQIQKEKEEKIRRSEYLAKKCGAIAKSRVKEEELSIKKAQEEKEAAEDEKRKARKRYEENLRAEMEEYRKELAILREKQKKDEEDFKAWEILQRSKRDEYNKEMIVKNFEQERLKKQKIAASLRRQIVMKEAEQKRLATLDDNSAEMKAIIEKTNEEVIRYGEEVLKESEGVRPLFPILKVVEQFKKEIGIAPRKISVEPNIPVKKPKLKRRPVYAKSIPENQLCYI